MKNLDKAILRDRGLLETKTQGRYIISTVRLNEKYQWRERDTNPDQAETDERDSCDMRSSRGDYVWPVRARRHVSRNFRQLSRGRTSSASILRRFVYLLWRPKGRFVYGTREGNVTHSFNNSCQTAGVNQNKTICRPSNIQVNKHSKILKINYSKLIEWYGRKFEKLVRLCNGESTHSHSYSCIGPKVEKCHCAQ